MTSRINLLNKYLKKIQARELPDGSVHPDDLNEAEFLVTMELLESGEIEPPEDSPPLSDREAMRTWLAMAQAHGNYDSVLDYIAFAVDKHERQIRNPPINRGRLPEAIELENKLNHHLGSGMKRSKAIEAIAAEFVTTTSAVYQKLRRAGYRLKK
jgi:hypothetical protein